MRRIALFAVLLGCCLPPAGAGEPQGDAFPLRNHNPFLQIFGLPGFETGQLAAPGGVDATLAFDIANDMELADRSGERLLIDSESRVINLSLRKRLGERYEIGLDVPYVDHSEGFLDSVIYEFHDLVGLSNSTRTGPDDQFGIRFARDGTTLFEMLEPAAGIGDVRLSAAMSFPRMTLRAGLKLPTGDPDKLTGSGAADFSLAVHGGGSTTLFDRDLAYSGFLGVLALGDGDVLPALQRSVVPFAGFGLRWHATERFSIGTQLYAQGEYFDIGLHELGGGTSQLAFGFDYRFPQQGLLLRAAIAEDVALDAAPDFALHLSLRRYTR